MLPTKDPGTSGTPGFRKYTWHKLAVRALRDRSSMPYARFYVLMVMFDYAGRDGTEIRPGTQLLADECNMDRRHIKNHVKALEADGWLILTEHGGHQHGKGMANKYRLGNGPKVAQALRPDCTPDRARGASDAPRGASDVHQGGQSVPPHQVTNQVTSQNSDENTSASPNTATTPEENHGPDETLPWNRPASNKSAEQKRDEHGLTPQDYELFTTDIEAFQDWADGEGLLGDHLNANQFEGIWQRGTHHPKAIINILKVRA